jgi:uncharacterized protein YhaN
VERKHWRSLELALEQRKEDAVRRETSLGVREDKLCLERAYLEMLENELNLGRQQLQREKDHYKERVRMANAKIEAQERDLHDKLSKKLAVDLEKARLDYHQKLETQDRRFTERKKELEGAQKKARCGGSAPPSME